MQRHGDEQPRRHGHPRLCGAVLQGRRRQAGAVARLPRSRCFPAAPASCASCALHCPRVSPPISPGRSTTTAGCWRWRMRRGLCPLWTPHASCRGRWPTTGAPTSRARSGWPTATPSSTSAGAMCVVFGDVGLGARVHLGWMHGAHGCMAGGGGWGLPPLLCIGRPCCSLLHAPPCRCVPPPVQDDMRMLTASGDQTISLWDTGARSARPTGVAVAAATAASSSFGARQCGVPSLADILMLTFSCAHSVTHLPHRPR